MVWLVILSSVTVAAFAWVTVRARSEWSRSDEISITTAVAISSLYVLVAALMTLALVFRPWPFDISSLLAIPSGSVLAVAGVAVTFAGARPFGSSARLYGVERGGLIQGGIYSFSRNPQYAGLVITFIGVAIAGRSALALLLAAAVGAAFWLWVVLVEEPHLARAFGARYERYRREVPRFLGLPQRYADGN